MPENVEELDETVDELEENVEEVANSEDEEYTPPTKEEFAALQKQLTKVNAEAKKHRLAAKAAKDAVPVDEDEITKARKEVEGKYRPMIVKSAVRESLKDAGLIGSPDRLLKLVDTNDLDIDDDGTVNDSDLDEIVASLKGDYPELFTAKRVGRIDGGRSADGRQPKPRTASEIQAEQALRR